MAKAAPITNAAPSSSVDLLLEEFAEKWKAGQGTPNAEVLRLSVLRDLVHRLHAEKSRLLSRRKPGVASSLCSVEARIEELRTCKTLTGELRPLLLGKESLEKRTRVLPDALFAVLEREKLERYDRQWEASLASEAVSQNWGFWSLEAWVNIPKVDEWNRKLGSVLWPRGIVLFVESANSFATGTVPLAWLGRWICILDPGIQSPADLLLDFPNWPGTESLPAWQLLFSPESL